MKEQPPCLQPNTMQQCRTTVIGNIHLHQVTQDKTIEPELEWLQHLLHLEMGS